MVPRAQSKRRGADGFRAGRKARSEILQRNRRTRRDAWPKRPAARGARLLRARHRAQSTEPLWISAARDFASATGSPRRGDGRFRARHQPQGRRADLLCAAGALLNQKGDFERAIADYDQALAIAPDNKAIQQQRQIAVASKTELAKAGAAVPQAPAAPAPPKPVQAPPSIQPAMT